jgi:hypothetical protein
MSEVKIRRLKQAGHIIKVEDESQKRLLMGNFTMGKS